MSNKIDQKVVEMRFDNKQFESNVQTTMSSIDKLKQKLNFTGATKGLENIDAASKKVNMSSLGSAVETIQAKFSALDVVAVTALANITNSALNAGKQIVSALTIEPVYTGFQEYETQMNAIQTILANTQSKGSTLDDVTKALDELNTYADQTIYNFTEMTRNIGTFTAAGVDLDKSVTSIKGIANLAAVSGSTSQQASTAMYQLSQALAAGKVQLMDWNSVVNAGMGGELFQNALKRTATQMGTNVDALIEKYGSFRESLTKGNWLTAEVLTETLTQLSGAYTKADLIAQGYTEKQAEEIVQLAETAVNAATKVKTFTQLWDTAKEAAQSGWAQTWKLIFGDFEEAKDFFSRVGENITGYIGESADARNNVLAGALNSGWDTFIQKVNEAGVSTEEFTERLTEAAKSHGVAVDDLIKEHGTLENAIAKGLIPTEVYTEALGKFEGKTTESAKALKEANEYIVKTGDNLTKIGAKYNMTWQELYKLNQDIIKDPNLIYPDQILKLGDAQLKQAGYTEKQISALKDLAKQAKETGTPINELIQTMGKPSGRQMLFATMSNAVNGFIGVLRTVRTAWGNIFPPENLSKAIYNFIEMMYNFSEGLILSTEDTDNLRRTLEGLFAIIDIVTTIVSGPFKLAFKVLSQVLGAFNMPVLEFTALLGDGAVALRNFILDNKIVNTAIDVMASAIVKGINAIKGWIDAFKELPIVQETITKLQNGLLNLKEVGLNAIEGLKNGLKNGITSIPEILIEIGKKILESIKNVLGIHSPSKEMEKIGNFTIQGLLNGLSQGAQLIIDWFANIGNMIINGIHSVDWSKLAALAISAGLVVTIKSMLNVLEAFASPFKGVGDILSGFGDILEEVSEKVGKLISAKAFAIRAAAVKDLAIAIAILAGSLYVLAKIPWQNLLTGLGAIAGLAVVIGVLAIAIGKWGPESTVKLIGFGGALITIGIALMTASAAIKILNTLDPDKLAKTLTAFGTMIASFAAIIATFGLLVKADASGNISKVGGMMLKMSIALLLMVAVFKVMSLLSEDEIKGGSILLLGFVGMMTLLGVAARIGGKNMASFSGTILAFSSSILLLTVAIKALSSLDKREIENGLVAITGFTLIIGVLVLITNLWKQAKGLGATLLAISASMLIMVAVVKLVSMLSADEILKGVAAMAAFTLFIKAMTLATKGASGTLGLAATLLAMSVSVGILAGICVVLSLIDLQGMLKGITVVGLLSTFVALMLKATKGAEDAKGTLIGISIAIGVIAASVVALSFIEPTKLLGATAAMTVLMGMFALILKSSTNVTGSIGVLITISAAIAVIGTVVYILSTLPVESVVPTTAAISMLLLALAGSMKILSQIKTVSSGALGALAVLTLIAAGIGAILGVLAYLDIQPSIETASSISILLLALAGATAILAMVGPMATGAIQAAGAMAAVIAIIAAIVLAAGGIAQIPGAKWLASEGGEFLQSIGVAIGAFIGGIGSGLAAGITAGLPVMASNLSNFMSNLQPFLDGCKQIDADAVSAVTSLGGMILALTAANIIDGIAKFFGFGDSMTNFATQLIPFGEAMATFGETIKGKIDPDSVNAAASAGMMLAELNKSLPRSGGALQDFIGSKDLGLFSQQMAAFGEAIVAFSQTVAPGGSSIVNENAVTAAANSGKLIADLNNELPRTGGALQEFLGTKDLGLFSEQMKAFGKAIVAFSETVAPGGSIKVNEAAVEAAVNAGTMLSELNNTLPAQNGVLQDFLGEKNFETFSEQLNSFGTAIVSFSRIVSSDGAINEEAITAAANAGKIMAALNEDIPKTGGLISLFSGDNSISEFGRQLVSFGLNFKTYAGYMNDIDAGVVTATANAADSLVDLADAVAKLETDGFFSDVTNLSDFGVQLSSFGAQFAVYYDKIKSISPFTLSSIVNEMWSLLELANSASTTNFDGLGSFGEALSKLGKNGIDGLIDTIANSKTRIQNTVSAMIANFINAIKGKKTEITSTFTALMDDCLKAINSKQDDYALAAIQLITQFVNGIKSKSQIVANEFEAIVATALNAMRKEHTSFRSLGGYLVDGFCVGINENTFKAEAQAIAMAEAALEAARATLGVASPSKEFEDIGRYTVSGFAKGIDENLETIEHSTSKMAESALNNTKNAIIKVAEAINGDMNVQPTIRPVLDLSDIQSGSRLLNTMFSRQQALSVDGIINRTSAATVQNGEDQKVSSQPVHQFIQNNYSPKALSRIEIYRQTKNQLSAYERMTKT